MARFIVFTEVSDENIACGDLAINADHIVAISELDGEAANDLGEMRPQCRIYLATPLNDGGENYDLAMHIDVLGGLIDTQQVLNWRPGEDPEHDCRFGLAQ